ncbi:hypothetical protein GQ607_003036 [Colletotrichum asianum]|uniref:Uncharacterized protein n=1 Tax=Colletotrichum asianum TaxID=702518 RepID=A0A8H3WKT0_9PEZI|nr:hypothetical protein GQ607_003036 [Colletotrichum asianum]
MSSQRPAMLQTPETGPEETRQLASNARVRESGFRSLRRSRKLVDEGGGDGKDDDVCVLGRATRECVGSDTTRRRTGGSSRVYA